MANILTTNRLWAVTVAAVIVAAGGAAWFLIPSRRTPDPQRISTQGDVVDTSDTQEADRDPKVARSEYPADILPTTEARTEALRNEAVAIANQILQDLPNRAEPAATLALAYNRFGLFDKADDAWQKCLEIDPNFTDAYHGQGEIALERGDYEEAIRHLRRTLELQPARPGARVLLGDALLHLGRIEEAVETLKEEVQTSPEASENFFRLGKAYAQLRDDENAKRCFETAIRIDPRCTYAYYGLGNVCRRMGHSDEAVDHLRKFQHLKEEDRVADRQRLETFDDESHVRQGTAFIQTVAGTVYRQYGKLAKAEQAWVRAAELHPRDTLSRSKLVGLYQEQNRLAKALAVLEELREIDPSNPSACLQMGAICARQGDFARAEAAFLEAMQLVPDRAAGYALCGQLYLQSGRNLPEAQRLLQRAVELEPNAHYFYLLSAATQHNGDLREPFPRLNELLNSIPQTSNMNRFAMRCGNIFKRRQIDPTRPERTLRPDDAVMYQVSSRVGRDATRPVPVASFLRAFGAGLWAVGWLLASIAGAQCPIQLRDVTANTNIDFRHTDGSSGRRYIVETVSAGLAVFDYDGDGLIDIYFLNGAPLRGTNVTTSPRNALYRNIGGWKFIDATDQAGVGDTGFGLGVTVADYDEDGNPDLYVNNFGANVLYRNNGDGTFRDATVEAGVADGHKVGAGACFLDIDKDGDVDLYSANYVKFTYDSHVPRTIDGFPEYAGPKDYAAEPDTLFRNNGNGTFTDISKQAGIRVESGTGMGMVCADFDCDGDTDIFVLNDVAGNFFFVNDGNGKFEEQGLLIGAGYNMDGHELGSMGVDCADFDNDGWLDFLMTSYQGELPVLYRNLGTSLLEDVTLISGAGSGSLPYVNWGTGIVDFDNDGDRDLFIAGGHLQDNIEQYADASAYEVRNVVLMNTGDSAFTNVSERVSDTPLPKRSSRGAVFDDLDNDGRVDAVVLNSRRAPTILRNESKASQRAWLQIRLRGVGSSRCAVGAQVRLKAGNLELVDEVHSGRSYQSHWGLRLHYGLGDVARVDRIEVRWIGGTTDVFQNVSVNQSILITERGGISTPAGAPAER